MTLFDLTGQVCVVTGSTKGMGRAIAERYCEHGARVVVTSRHGDEAEAVAAELNNRYGAGKAAALAFDLMDRERLSAPIDFALDKWGRIDTLVGNAAKVVNVPLSRATGDDFDQSFAGNVANNALMAKAAAPAMKAQGGGSIIFISSTVGLFPSPPYLPYSVSKAALVHLAAILAVDLGPDNIRVNAICPGLIKTFSTAKLAANPDDIALAIGRNPLGRMGEPDEIAACAVLLASKGGAYITGQVHVIDGGQIHQGREAARNLAEVVRARPA